MELAAARDDERVGLVRRCDTERDVALQLFFEALAQVARGDVLALLADEGTVVRDELHRDGGLVDGDALEDARELDRRDGLADVELAHARDGDDVTGRTLGDLEALEPLRREDLLRAELLHLAVAVREQHAVADLDVTIDDAADGDEAEEVVVVERGDLHAERRVEVGLGPRGLLEDHVEERREALVGRVRRLANRVAGAARRVNDGEVELLVRGAERDEEVEHVVDGALDVAALAVDLVDDEDGAETERERLLRDEARLGHRALERVDEEADAVDHAEDALDLATEVGVAWRVDDVDADTLPGDRRRLRQDGDAALTLERVGVERALLHDLTAAEGAGLREEPVDEGGLPVIDVGNDGDVSDVRSDAHGARSLPPTHVRRKARFSTIPFVSRDTTPGQPRLPRALNTARPSSSPVRTRRSTSSDRRSRRRFAVRTMTNSSSPSIFSTTQRPNVAWSM